MQVMSRRAGTALALIAAAIVALVGISAVMNTAGGSAQAQTSSTQVNDEGEVTVQITPLALSPTADPWRFDVQFTTHMWAMDQDLLKAASLQGDNGQVETPSGWEGDGPGGHHRKGVLVFKPIVPAPGSVTLTLRGIGPVPERSFTWKVAAQ